MLYWSLGFIKFIFTYSYDILIIIDFFLFSSTTNSDLLEQTEVKLNELEKSKFKQVAMELQGTDPYMFLRAYSPGINL